MEGEEEPIGTLSDEVLAADLHWKECVERHLVSWGHGGKDLVASLEEIRSAIAGLLDELARRKSNNGQHHNAENGGGPNLAPGTEK